MMLRLNAPLFFLMLVCSPAVAENPYSAKAYEPGCRIIAENSRPTEMMLAVQAGQCLGAVRTIGLLNPTLDRPRRYCAPPEVVLVQQIQAITKYMDTHPDRMSQDFVRVAVAALNETWPCQ